ncbi:MAG: type VI secretion system-associated protein TagF [Proteobacteria bacterium]|nr:type VI secretion system-associated protein TagF [Pseudomonadota bacterium]MCL2590683.1 type VI secretion system-associated protein TagF [Betaproteobacteria bacterium]
MPIAYKPARDTIPRYAVFGKLPRRADFVRIGGDHPLPREFDELIGRSLALLQRQSGWIEESCLGTGACDFQFTSRDGRECFTGVLHPSRDESGRVFPLVAGILLPAQAVVPYAPELSIANELYFSGLREQLSSAVENAVDLVACRQFLETWAAPNPHAGEDIALGEEILKRHMNRTSAGEWHVALQEAGLGGLDDLLLASTLSDSTMQRKAAPVLLPLSGKEGEDTLDLAAWLALYRVASGQHCTPDYLCGFRNGQRVLAVSSGRFGEWFLAALWGMKPMPPADGSNTAWKQHPMQTEFALTLGRLLLDPTVNLAQLIEALERIVRNLADKPVRNKGFHFSFVN